MVLPDRLSSRPKEKTEEVLRKLGGNMFEHCPKWGKPTQEGGKLAELC